MPFLRRFFSYVLVQYSCDGPARHSIYGVVVQNPADTYIAMTLASLSLIGFPFLSGFYRKIFC